MKKIKITYWTLACVLAVLMAMSAIPDIMMVQSAVEMITGHLGYPEYFLPFIGVAKLLGAIALLIPGYPRVKEWVFAGFVYDLVAAIYSSAAVGDPPTYWIPAIVGLILIGFTYVFHHKHLKAAVSHSQSAHTAV